MFPSSDPRWSYARLEPDDRRVAQVREKQVISDLACTGLYLWRDGSSFVSTARDIMQRGERVRGVYFISQVVNLAIELGAHCEAVRAGRVWPLKSVPEVQAFAAHKLASNEREHMAAIYKEMAARNARALELGGFQHDPELAEEGDPRRCLAVYRLCGEDAFVPTPRMTSLLHRLHEVFSHRHVVYQPAKPEAGRPLQGHLHFTYMQLVGFAAWPALRDQMPVDYGKVVEANLIQSLPAFEIHFHQVIATPKSIVVVGYPTAPLNWNREQLRTELKRIGYPLAEPYVNDIAHMTLVRFAAPLEEDELTSVRSVVAEHASGSLGTLHVKALSVGAASWRMQPHELDARTTIVLGE